MKLSRSHLQTIFESIVLCMLLGAMFVVILHLPSHPLVQSQKKVVLNDIDQRCEDETDTHELSEVSDVCWHWVMDGDTCAEQDGGCS